MYPPRQGTGSQQNQVRISVPEACDRIKDELTFLQQQCHNFKADCERLTQEKNELQRGYGVYYDLHCNLTLEFHKQVEIGKRLTTIISQLLPMLPPEHQSQVVAATERAKQISLQEMGNLINQQMMFPGGGPLGAGFPPNGIPGLPSQPPPTSAVNGSGSGGAAGGGGLNASPNSAVSNLLLMPGAHPNPLVPPTSGANSAANSAAAAAAAFMAASGGNVAPTSTSPGFSNPSIVAQQQMAAAMAAMAAGFQAGNPNAAAAAAAAFGFPNPNQVPTQSGAAAGGAPAVPNQPPMMSPNSLSSFLDGKNMDEKQRQATAAMAAAMQAMAAQQYGDPTAMFASFAAGLPPHSMPSGAGAGTGGGGGGGGFDLSQSACAAAAAAAAGILPPAPPPSQPSLQQVPPASSTEATGAPVATETVSAAHTPTSGAQKQPARASSTLGFTADAKRPRFDNENTTAALNGGDKDHSPRENGNGEAKTASSPAGNGNGTNTNGESKTSPQPLQQPGSPQRTQAAPLSTTPIVITTDGLPPAALGPGTLPPGFMPPGLITSTPSHPAMLSRFPLTPGLPPGLSSPLANPAALIRPPGPSPLSFDAGSLRSSNVPPPRTPYVFVYSEGQAPTPLNLPAEGFGGPGVPYGAKVVHTFDHGQVVCAVMINSTARRVYTGGRGTVKIWDMAAAAAETNGSISLAGATSNALASLDCLNGGHYVRSIKSGQDGNLLVVGGEAPMISLWDVGDNVPRAKGEIDIGAQACYAVAVTNDGKLGYFCQSDGIITLWDLHNHSKIHELRGHADGASCVDLSTDGVQLWTGGLDKAVRSWDIRDTHRQVNQYIFEAQIFSLAKSPTEDWVAAGLESNEIELFAPGRVERYRLELHDSCVLSLKFAHSGAWFASTGKDSMLNFWRPPFGANLFRVKEALSILSCDVSSDDRYVATGSGEKKASLYEVSY